MKESLYKSPTELAIVELVIAIAVIIVTVILIEMIEVQEEMVMNLAMIDVITVVNSAILQMNALCLREVVNVL